jgi:type III secretion system FlhB-like substrate exporter
MRGGPSKMNAQTNNNKNNNNNNNNNNTRKRARNRNRRRNRIARRNRVLAIRANNRRRNRQRMAAAYTRNVPKTFNTMQLSGTSAIVSGTDLIYKIPTQLIGDTTTSVITLIPANPAYWTGTRISAIAQGYQNYRPLNFKVHYIPQCAVTQQGNVLAGTLWNEVPTEDNLQQTLKTSNGGTLTQCYKPAISTVRMKTNLQYNLYRMGGAIDQESNPFTFMALQIGCTDANSQPIIPGYFYITYKYILKNPIGTGIIYQNKGRTTLDANMQVLNNSVAYTLTQQTLNNITIPTGTRLDVEKQQNGQVEVYYNGTYLITIGEQQTLTPVWILQNQPNIAPTQMRSNTSAKIPIYYDNSVTAVLGTIELQTRVPMSYETQNYIVTFINIGETANVTVEPNTKFYYTSEFNTFGQLTFSENNTLIFEADKLEYELVFGQYPRSNTPNTIARKIEQQNIKAILDTITDISNIDINDEQEDPKDDP